MFYALLVFCSLGIAGISPSSAETMSPANTSPGAETSPTGSVLSQPPSAQSNLSYYEETFERAYPDPDSLDKGANWVTGTASTTWVARNLAEEKDTAKFLKGITGNQAFVEKRTPLIHKIFKSRIVGRAIVVVGAAAGAYKLFQLYRSYHDRDNGIIPAGRMSASTVQRLYLQGEKR